MSTPIPDRPGSANRLVPAITLVVMALVLGGTTLGLALYEHTNPSAIYGGFDSSIRTGVTEAFTVSGINPQVSGSGDYFFTQDNPSADSTTTTLYSLGSSNSDQPTQVWSGTCAHAGLWGDKLLCDSTLVATDGSSSSFPEGEGRSILASSQDVVVLSELLDESTGNLSTVSMEGVGTDGSVVWSMEDTYIGVSVVPQAGRRSWDYSQYLTAITRSNAAVNPAQSQVIELDTGTVIRGADSEKTLFCALNDGYYAFPSGTDGDLTIHTWDGSVAYRGSYHAATDRPDGDDSSNFAGPPVTTDEFSMIDKASNGLTSTVVIHDGEATVYEGVSTSDSMACSSLTMEGATIDTSSMSDGASCDLTLHEAGPRSLLVTSTEHGSALWNLDDGGSWWTSEVSGLKTARNGLLVGVRDGSTVGLVPA